MRRRSAAISMRGSTPNAPMGPSSTSTSQPARGEVQLHWMACDLRIATCAPRFANVIAMRVLHFAMKRCSLCPLRVWAISLSFFKYRAHVPVVAPSTSKMIGVQSIPRCRRRSSIVGAPASKCMGYYL